MELGTWFSDVDDSSAMKNATRAKLTGRVQKKLKFWDGLGCSALGGHGACIHPLIREIAMDQIHYKATRSNPVNYA